MNREKEEKEETGQVLAHKAGTLVTIGLARSDGIVHGVSVCPGDIS